MRTGRQHVSRVTWRGVTSVRVAGPGKTDSVTRLVDSGPGGVVTLVTRDGDGQHRKHQHRVLLLLLHTVHTITPRHQADTWTTDTR